MNRNHWRHPYAAGTKAAALLAMAIGIAIGGGHGNAAASNNTPKLSERTPAAGIDEMAEAGPQHVNRPRIAVIIDDFGNGLRGTEEMFALPIKLTVAVMPFLSTSEADARRAHERGFDVLVHLP
ncbi:divergent polysaccharide deacetylase family protein, partial [Paenibacillus forsythiae]